MIPTPPPSNSLPCQLNHEPLGLRLEEVVAVDRVELSLGRIWRSWYHSSVTMIRTDYLLAGMHAASTVASSCAGTASAIASVWNMTEHRGDSQPRCFRSFRQPSAPLVGERPGRKQRPEEKSHISLSFAVCPARNVA
jgi:hypothetical protein